MSLPLLIAAGRTEDRRISVDGVWDQPGLNLSHWPGNATPPKLRHDLSTGIALAFACLEPEERGRLSSGCTAIANNHFDTDGVCAMFALARPELALARERALLDTAAAGDFFQVPSQEAFCLDAAITNMAEPERSPWSSRFRGLDPRARHETAVREIVSHLPEMLDGGLDAYSELWRPELEDLRADLAALSAASRDDVVHLDLAVWESRAGAPFEPGRHALFGSTRSDRVLAIGPRSGGSTYRLLLSTRSWFDLPSHRPLPRPDLSALAERLNEMEGSDPAGEAAWRAQDAASPSPELWFGAVELEDFAERSPALRQSRLEPASVRRAVADALRESWAFPSA